MVVALRPDAREAGPSAEPKKQTATSPAPAAAPAEDLARNACRKVSCEYLLVTVPDPLASRASYLFDSMVESVQRAAEESGYLPDRFSLPWSEEAAKQSAGGARGRPGVMLFRGDGSRPPLVVVLVGETPTVGLDREAFGKALALAAPPGGSGAKTVRVAGPSFSGSAVSLGAAIDAAPCRNFNIVSGSATSPAVAKLLANPRVTYRAMIENDGFALARLFNYFDSQNIPPHRVAILSEAGTAFGAGVARSAGASGDPLSLPFPLEIARLRNAYQEPPEPEVLGLPKQEKTPRTGAELKLKDTRASADRVPAFAPEQTAVAQELILTNIAATIRRHNIQAVGIIASDIMDALFLARYVARNCPDTRVFTLDSDVLYQHSSKTISSYGALLVSAYPLYGPNQMWQQAAGGRRQVLHFPSAAAQGLYNACRVLLEARTDERRLMEYSHPFDSGASNPPLWLVVVGREGVWPVRLLNRPGEAGSTMAPLPAPARPGPRAPLPQPPQLWYVAVWLLVLIVGWHAVHVMYVTGGTGGDARPKREFHVYTDVPDSLGPDALFHLTVVALALYAALFPLETAQLAYVLASNSDATHAAQLTALVGALALVVLLGLALWWIWRWGAALWLGWRIVAALAGAGLTLAYSRAWWTIQSEGGRLGSNDPFFTVRSLELTSGVSPVLAVALVMSGLAAWGAAHLQRLRLCEVRTPGFPNIEGADQRLSGLGAAVDLANVSISSFWFNAWALGGCALIAGMAVFLLRDLRSLEGRLYDGLFGTAAALLLCTILLTMARFLWIWERLSRVLRRLRWHPLGAAFGRLAEEIPEISSHSIWRRGGKPYAHCALAHSVEYLRRLSVWFPCQSQQQVESDVAEILESDAARERENAALLERINTALNQCAKKLADDKLKEWWERPPRPDDAAKLQMAENYLALRLAAFLRYANAQLRNLLEFASTGLLLLLVALSTYPFQPRRALVIGLSILFTSLAVSALVVFAQMDRDAILSRLSGSAEGKVGRHFLVSAVSYGAAPLATFLVSQYPEAGRILLNLLGPLLQALQ